MKLAVGFITYNDASLKYLPDFLASLKEALSYLNDSEFRVLAFDNSDNGYSGNQDELNKFNKLHPGFVACLKAGENLGFSRAYNILIKQAEIYRADYFLVINPDTYLEKDLISKLCLALDENINLGSVSPKIRRWDFPANTKTKVIDSVGIALSCGLRFFDLGQGEVDSKQFDRQQILGPSGAAGLFRLSALRQVVENEDFFDERFFMYKEDCDLAYRLSKKGWKSSIAPEAVLYHDRTAATSSRFYLLRAFNRSNKSRQVRAWSFVNQHLLFIKHWSNESFISKIIIICQVLAFGFFSLILEQFLLKEYKNILQLRRNQKSID